MKETRPLDWMVVTAIVLSLCAVLAIRIWAGRQTCFYAGFVLLIIGLPACYGIRELAKSDLVQSEAIIWPLIILPSSTLVLGFMLIVRGVIGFVRNRLREQRLNDSKLT